MHHGEGDTMSTLPTLRDATTDLPAERAASGAVLVRELGAQVAATMQAAARSVHSERAYRHGIGLFLQYLDGALTDGNRPLELATTHKEGRATQWAFGGKVGVLRMVEPGHLDGFRAWREAQGDSPNTASLRLAAARTFLSVALRDGILTPDQGARMGLRPYKARQKRDRKETGRRLTQAEVRDLRATFDTTTNKGKRDRAILDLAFFAGLRCEEIASLDVSNLQQDRGRWWLVFEGKGSKTRKVKVHDMLWESLDAWLRATDRTVGSGEGAVFVGVNKGDRVGDKAISTATVNRLVAEYGHKAGLSPLHGKNRLGPHDLRRTCARNAYDNGAPLPQIQRMLGHADITTTMRYIGTDTGNGGGAVDFVRYYTEGE